ncbi:MAG: hypothetical protein Q7R64_01915 [bacterium]|nr:hypothetical protein [bacterium]
MKNVVPDGLGAFLQQRFGGELVAPVQPNPCGHRADSNARIVKIQGFILNEVIDQAVCEYYTSVGGEITASNPAFLSFWVEGKGLELLAVLSNYSKAEGGENSQIFITVTEK